jgi:hypothetical protein
LRGHKLRISPGLPGVAGLGVPSGPTKKPRRFRGECAHQIETLLKPLGKNAANPELGIYVLKPVGAAYWVVGDLCECLRRADVPFVRVDFSTPLVGFLSPDGQKALAQIGVEFWNKDE